MLAVRELTRYRVLLGRKEVEPKTWQGEVFLVCLVAELKKRRGGGGKVGSRKKER